MSHRILLLVPALALLTSCLPEAQLARLLDRHPGLLTQVVGPQQVSDSTVVQVLDSTVTVRVNGQLYRVPVKVRQITRYRSRISTLVLDNARARRLLADARADAGVLRKQLQASEQERGRLQGLAYPHWYGQVWFWIALLLLVLLVGSVALRFTKFSFLPF
ncbi:hypothetical protein [Hymenobacter cheonanensis]|uniref:hypothetical protein n=1 Tax=Hymenobacter sp. CA2-7 TaxID=3063993 RepID=UPI002713BF5A|nr:hypothetical protein [Hymenobacter sp. CA2-7]MDO7886836.1 hypothetical protein [Hymenobacter sp. CA2-7]